MVWQLSTQDEKALFSFCLSRILHCGPVLLQNFAGIDAKGKVRTLLEWVDELLSKIADGLDGVEWILLTLL